jgi:hypothetical protein
VKRFGHLRRAITVLGRLRSFDRSGQSGVHSRSFCSNGYLYRLRPGRYDTSALTYEKAQWKCRVQAFDAADSQVPPSDSIVCPFAQVEV